MKKILTIIAAIIFFSCTKETKETTQDKVAVVNIYNEKNELISSDTTVIK